MEDWMNRLWFIVDFVIDFYLYLLNSIEFIRKIYPIITINSYTDQGKIFEIIIHLIIGHDIAVNKRFYWCLWVIYIVNKNNKARLI